MYQPSHALATLLLGAVPNAKALPISTRLTLAVTVAHMHGQRVSTFVSAATVARIRGIGERSVRRHLDDLVHAGLLVKTVRPGTSSIYAVTFPVAEQPVSLQLPSLIPEARRTKQSMSRATVQYCAAVYYALRSRLPVVYAKDVAAIVGCSSEEARRALKVARITPAHGSAKAETVLSRHPRNRTLMSQDKPDNLPGNRTVATVEVVMGSEVEEEEPNGSSSPPDGGVDFTGVETNQTGTRVTKDDQGSDAIADVIDISESRVSNSPLPEVDANSTLVEPPMVVSLITEGGPTVKDLFAEQRAPEYEQPSRQTSVPRGAKPLKAWSTRDVAEEFRLEYSRRHGFCHINVTRLAMILSRNRKTQNMDARHEMKIFHRWVGSKYAEGDGDPVARYLASFPYHRFAVEQEIADEDPTYVSITQQNQEDRISEANDEMTKHQSELMDYYAEVFGA